MQVRKAAPRGAKEFFFQKDNRSADVFEISQSVSAE
jgi:hypothetical protein